MKTITYKLPSGATIQICRANLASYSGDAIVRQTTRKIWRAHPTSPLDVALFQTAGNSIFKEASDVEHAYPAENRNSRGKIPAYSAHLTSAGRLNTKYIIHTVTAIKETREHLPISTPKDVRKGLESAFDLAHSMKFRMVKVPVIFSPYTQKNKHLEYLEAVVDQSLKSLDNPTSINTLTLGTTDHADYDFINNKLERYR